MSIGEKITILRKENNMTQEQLADVLSVSRQSVSRWESDIAFPETDKLLQLCNIFKCSVDYLLKDEITDKNANYVEYKEVYVNKSEDKSKKYKYVIGALSIALVLVSCTSIASIIMLNNNDINDKIPYENDSFCLEFKDDESNKYEFSKNVINNGIETIVSYSYEDLPIKYKSEFKIYCENSNITIDSLTGFNYLNNGYFMQNSEGLYDVIINVNYLENQISNIETIIEKVGSTYSNVKMHIIGSYNTATYEMELIENQTTNFGDNYKYVWTSKEEVSLYNGNIFYFTLDGEKVIDLQFGNSIIDSFKNMLSKTDKGILYTNNTGFLTKVESNWILVFNDSISLERKN